MKTHIRNTVLVVLLFAGKIQASEVLGAIASSAQALSDVTLKVNTLVGTINASIGTIEQRVSSLSRSFQSIGTSVQPQMIVSSSFQAIDNALGFQEVIMPMIEELIDVVATISDSLLPAISKFSGVPVEIGQAGKEMSSAVALINRVKDEMIVWNLKIRKLAASIGTHVLDMTQQIEETVADVRKMF